jgi:GntR family transcriptional regulator / MocR family aminotransferase
MAKDLSVSRNTVLFAYDQLISEGYCVAHEGSGTFVSSEVFSSETLKGGTPLKRAAGAVLPKTASAKTVAAKPVSARTAAEVPTMPPQTSAIAAQKSSLAFVRSMLSATAQALGDGRTNLTTAYEVGPKIDFKYGEPAFSDLPIETWARLVGRRARNLTERQLSYQTAHGTQELRSALCRYLARARGVSCSPEQIVIVQGTQQGIDLVNRLLIDERDSVVVEEPQYRGLVASLEMMKADIQFVPVDEEGMQVDHLSDIQHAKMINVTPSHQFPAGGVLSLKRRLKLLDWAKTKNAFVLEDDYDGEFRYEGRPIPSLQSLDKDGRVIYMGTTSKILFPALRIGWLVMPEPLVAPMRMLKSIADRGSSTLEQLALCDLITEGHLDRHIHRIRKRHARRRKVLINAIEKHMGNRVTVIGSQAGIHLLLRIDSLKAKYSQAVVASARERGVGVYSTEPYYNKAPAKIELILGYAAVSEGLIEEGIKRLKQAVDQTETDASI